jgi:HlyD family secretion protein
MFSITKKLLSTSCIKTSYRIYFDYLTNSTTAMRERLISILTVLSKPAVAIGGAVVIGAAIVGLAWHASLPQSGAYAAATVGPITEEVDVTGTVKAAHSTDLSFQTSGRVAVINVAVGDHVSASQTLVALDTSSQAASIALAKANLEAQQAKLDALTTGTRPEQLAIDQTAVTQAQNALTSAIQTAYATAHSAVFGSADQVFANATTPIATLTILPPNATNPIVGTADSERVALNATFATWQAALASATEDTETLAALSETNLASVQTFLNNVLTALSDGQELGSVSTTAFVGYQTSISGAETGVSGALTALIGADTGYKAANGGLTLAQAGATANDLAAQKAAVDAAQASLQAAQAAASQAVIVAPVAGTITAQNANLGQTVVPGVPLVSIIADGKYEADAQVSEADIAKVQLNDTVNVTSAAYPGVTFPATVTTVDPAASVDSNGVASYGVTVTFLNDDARLLPGLSANVHIITATKDSALLIPTTAIITNGDQKFVYVKTSKGSVQTPITTGIESANGMTEVTSGLSAGESVLSI